MWRLAELDEKYVRRMEDVLTLYEKPLSEEEPVVCIDEKAGGAAPGHSCSEARPSGALGPARLRVQARRHGQRLQRRGAESGATISRAYSHALGGGVCRLPGGDRRSLS